MSEQDLDKLRESKLEQRKRMEKQKGEWINKGHGKYREINDENEFFRECKQSRNVVIHFYRSSTWRCEIVDNHIKKLMVEHLETKFLKINAEKCPFLVERLNVTVIPTIVCV